MKSGFPFVRSLFLHFRVFLPPSTSLGTFSRCSIMSGTQLLRLLVNERLTAAAEEIFGLVEKTIAEYQDEAVRSKREVMQLRQQIEQLTVLKPEVVLFRADTQPVSEQLPLPLQQDDIKVEQVTILEESEFQEHPEVKEEQVDLSIGSDMEADISSDAEVRHPESDPATNSEQLPSSTAETVSVNESIEDEWDESDASSSPQETHSTKVFVELAQPPMGERSCRFCGEHFKRDAHLITHVSQNHNGQKAFKCLMCNKEFDQRHHIVMHTRIHTGERPFSCDFCDKTFVQNSTRLVHMRTHTGEKPYFCNKCGKSFAISNHLRLCNAQNECKTTPQKRTVGKGSKEEKPFKCTRCDKRFKLKHQLVLHTRVHTGEKPYSCDFCGKAFAQSSSRISHMRQHTGEKPYFCKKCGRSFTNGKHSKYCTGKPNKNAQKSFRCTTCGKTFYTDSELKVHTEIHESWKRHLSEKLEEQELDD